MDLAQLTKDADARTPTTHHRQSSQSVSTVSTYTIFLRGVNDGAWRKDRDCCA